METTSKKSANWAKNMSLLGMGLCVACCALPVVGIIGGTGILATIAIYSEKIAVVLLVLSAGLFVFWLYKKKQSPPSCSIDCTCKTAHVESKQSPE